MTINITSARNDYTGAGSVGPYAYGFEIYAETDLEVVTRTTAGVETTLTYLTDYTVTGAGNAAGGTVTLVVALATGAALTIRRAMPLLQAATLRNQGTYFPETIEDQLDRTMAILQQQEDAIARSLHLGPTFDPAGYDLVLPAPAAGKVVTGTGTGFTMATLDASATALPGETRTVTTLSAYLSHNAVYNVQDYGAVADGLSGSGTANAVAFNLALSTAITSGGDVVVPPGSYYLNAQWLGTFTSGNTNRVRIIGYGAVLFAGAAVTGSAIKITTPPQPNGITILGLKGDHRGNTTVGAFIELSGCSHSVIDDVTVERDSTKANYAAVLLSASTPGDDNTACFWTLIRRLRTRKRGSGGTNGAYDVWIKGAHNHTSIEGCSFTHCNDAIHITNDGTGLSMPNAVRSINNAFESGITNCVAVVNTPGNLWPTGLLICQNRVESATTFLSYTTGGAVGLEHSFPPVLYGNYVTNGSVTNYVVNPTAANICCFDMQATGAAVAPFRLQSADHMKLVMPTSKNLILANASGSSAWNFAHLQLGEDGVGSAHLWVDNGTGNLRYKASAPTSATDGFMIGANGGSLTVPGLTITASSSKIIPGTTQLSLRNNADSADNLLVTDAGNVTARGTMTATGYKVGAAQVLTSQQASASQAAVTLGNVDGAIAALTISAAYSQAEVQALRAACETLADDVRALSVLLHALRTAGVTHGYIKGSA